MTIRPPGGQLDFWVDVRLRRFDRGWLAVADLAHEPELGFGDSACEAYPPPCGRLVSARLKR